MFLTREKIPSPDASCTASAILSITDAPPERATHLHLYATVRTVPPLVLTNATKEDRVSK
jgi:hypothetical protein